MILGKQQLRAEVKTARLRILGPRVEEGLVKAVESSRAGELQKRAALR